MSGLRTGPISSIAHTKGGYLRARCVRCVHKPDRLDVDAWQCAVDGALERVQQKYGSPACVLANAGYTRVSDTDIIVSRECTTYQKAEM